ncbi:MAG TPA: DNA double-strand break repair nuclease NurA [Blastocatellia bacterium]|nr:DNA double-strand break repair nuclease NurA [Blastocatellia bacterium]
MIYRDKIAAAFEARREEFIRFNSETALEAALYRDAIDRVSGLDRSGLASLLKDAAAPGALPTADFDRAKGMIIAFDAEWRNHEEARDWAYHKLLGRTTFAADGSQILPTKDVSVPVAAVQVGWFENRHTPGGGYVKDAAFEVLAPSEITGGSGVALAVSEQAVHRRRYALETSAIRHYMLAQAERGFDPESPPVVFFDSLLVISFAETFTPESQQFYVNEITSLLDTSEKTGIPLIGYVDTSFARDLAVMLQTAMGLPVSHKVSDASILSPRMRWGDRTAYFLCARQGILDSYGEAWRRGIGFFYLGTSTDARPARIDIPAWVYERGLLDYVADTVRAEVVAGNGYPYPLETADVTAVLTARDREVFYAMFQEFARRQQLEMRIARKALSKSHRR